MPVSVNPIQPGGQNDLDAVLKAVSIATSVYGAKLDNAKATKLADLAQKKEEAAQATETAKTTRETEKDAIAFNKDFTPAKEGQPGAAMLKIPGTQTTGLFIPRSEQERVDKNNLEWAKLHNKDKPNDFEGKLAALPVAEKARYDNIVMATKALQDMNAALDAGQNTFSLVGDNNYTLSRRAYGEALGRMQSGGAINKDEAANFLAMAPTWKDLDPTIRQTKMAKLTDEMGSRLNTLGFKLEEVPGLANRASSTNDMLSGLSERGKAALAAKAARSSSKNTAGNQ